MEKEKSYSGFILAGITKKYYFESLDLSGLGP